MLHTERPKFMRLALATTLLTLSAAVQAAGNFSVMYGNKSLNKDDWQPLDTQTAFGLGFEFQKPNWPLALVMSYLSARDSSLAPTLSGDVRITGETSELGIGARKYLTTDYLRVFLEGGVASISATIGAEFQGTAVALSDTAMGPWFGAGADVMIGDTLSIGVLGRMSNASVRLGGVDAEAGGTHIGIFAAFHFE